ncbi:hypothetical protein BC332_18454 [Capsicum chinense]|nr:hypothetical protein BC332_18454 [Capsicum chinense]
MASISRSINEVQKFYHLSGLPYALQIWWYECCAKVDESLAVHVHNLIPRIVNWKAVKLKPRYEDLMDDMFSKLVYRNITPSPQELNHLDLPNPLMFGSTDDATNVAQVDMKFNDLQKLMVDQYTGFLGVVKDGFASFDKVAQYPVHESEKGNSNIEVDPPQSINEHTTNAKSYNVVDVVGQSSKLGVNEGPTEESLKELQYFIITLTSHFKYVTRESEEALHNTDENLSKAITLYVPPSRATYPTGINYEDAANIEKYDRQGNIDSHCYISDNDIAAISQVPVCKTNLKYVRKLTSKRNRKGKDEYYTTKQADLKPTLDFVVAHPVKKSWFYYMAQSSNYWNDEVLVVIVLKKRCIRIYDSMKGHRGHADEVKEHAEMLSTYLTISDFFEKEDRTDWSLLDVYKEKID